MALADVRGVVFDLDGCVWKGTQVTPGARELIRELCRRDRRVAFLTNNSRATARDIYEQLQRFAIEADPQRVLTPLEILAEFIREHHGPSRVLVMGAEQMAQVVRAGGHEVVPFERWEGATVVAVGNDFDLSYGRLAAAARAVAAGAALVTPNVDPRLPIEGGGFLPGCGAIVEAVSIAAGGRRPEIVGKPEPPLFRMALARLGVAPAEAVMVGDSLAADIRGAHGVGMWAVHYAPDGAPAAAEPDLTVRSFAELRALLVP
jgi:HAD superfamily hydrolase (TIGR01450 family)